MTMKYYMDGWVRFCEGSLGRSRLARFSEVWCAEQYQGKLEIYCGVHCFEDALKEAVEENFHSLVFDLDWFDKEALHLKRGRAFYVMDIDCEDLDLARSWALLISKYDPESEIYFSGANGFHVHSRKDLRIKARSLRIPFDETVDCPSRVLRMPDSVNIKTGLKKILLDKNELERLTIKEIKERAKVVT